MPIRRPRTVPPVHPPARAVPGLLAVVLLVVACGSATPTPDASAGGSPGPTPSPAASAEVSATASAVGPASAPPNATPGATPSSTVPPSPAVGSTDACVGAVDARLTAPERIGQLFLMGLGADRLGTAELRAIRTSHIGSVWFTATTGIGVAGVRHVADAVQARVTSTGGVGFYVAANQEGGRIQALRGLGFVRIPSALVQGRQTPVALQALAVGWGRALRRAGVNLDFAPVLDVVTPGTDARNQPIGALGREYGHDPVTAGDRGAAVIRGLARAGVASTAKHFPGLGRVLGNTDDVAGVVDQVTSATDGDLGSFRRGIAAGVPFVMVALATYPRIDPDHLAVFSSRVIGDLLRRDMGFGGVVMSDDLGAAVAVGSVPVGRRAVDFLSAGGDLVVVKSATAAEAMALAVRERAASDPAFAARVDDAVRRVIRSKVAAGLVRCPG